MKLILMMLIWLVPIAFTPVDDNNERFLNSVDEAYTAYEIYLEDNNQYYDLLVVKGICNSKPCYGICFTNVNAKMYNLVLFEDSLAYSLPLDDRGDISVVAFEASSTYEIEIQDKDGYRFYLDQSILIPFTTNNFDITSEIPGQGKGTTITELILFTQKIPFVKTVILVSSLIIGICTILIVLLFVFRKGMFDKDKRRIGIMNVKEILEKDVNQKAYTEDDFWSDVRKPQEESNPIQDKPVSQSSFFKEDEEQSTNYNIKEHLENLGYITKYNLLSEEEKNKIMLELMHLKDNGKISLKDYYTETSELWKK